MKPSRSPAENCRAKAVLAMARLVDRKAPASEEKA
jgi:hypothetical protein